MRSGRTSSGGSCLPLFFLLFSQTHAAFEDTQLAAAGAGSDPVTAWKTRAASAAEVVEQALRRHDPSRDVELKRVDTDSLRIWHGQRLELALEVDSTTYQFLTESEPDWHALADALPPPAGGAQVPGTVTPRSPDWDSLERQWVAPITRGPLLPDFVLEGPLDLYVRTPAALQLYLPHPADVGKLSRVLLREGAAVTVRGARSVGLRRPVDMPPLSLGDFASIVTTDAQEHPAAGLLHLVEGVRQAAVQRWNVTHPDVSLAVVALELEFPPQGGGALLAAPAPGAHSGLQRLKPRRLKEGVVELAPRDSLSEDESRALALAGGAPYAWPLRGVHPQHLQAYERLLREVLSSQVFSAAAAQGSGGVRVQPDMQLRLMKTQAEAMTLLQLRVEVERRLKPSAAEEGGGQGQDGAEGGARQQQRRQQQQLGESGGAGAGAAGGGRNGEAGGGGGGSNSGGGAVMERPPDTLALLVQPKYGPHEVWDATLQVTRDPRTGALRFVPVRIQLAGAARQTVSFSPSAVSGLVGNFTAESLQMLLGSAGGDEGGKEHEEL